MAKEEEKRNDERKRDLYRGLIPLSLRSKEERKRIQHMTKGVTSEKKRWAAVLRSSKFAKCKHCKVDCAYREQRLKANPECVCHIPRLRALAIKHNIPIGNLNEAYFDGILEDCLNVFKEYYEKAKEVDLSKTDKQSRKFINDFLRRTNILYTKALELRTKLFPPTQRVESVGININVDGDMAERVLRRLAEARLEKEMGVKVVRQDEEKDEEKKESEGKEKSIEVKE